MQTFPLDDIGTAPVLAKELFEAASRLSFFNSAEWFSLVGRYGLEPDWRNELAMSDDGTTGIVLRLPQSGNPKKLFNAENPYSCTCDVLLRDPQSDSVRRFAQRLITKAFQPQTMRLRGLSPDTKYFGSLLDGFEDAGFVAKPYFDWAIWYAGVDGWDFEKYISALPSVLRNTWQRKTAALKKATSFSIAIYSGGESIEAFIADYAVVQKQSWKPVEPHPVFIPNAIRCFARAGVLRMGILRIADMPAAAQFWIVSNGRATLFKLNYSENYSQYSPGTVLTMSMVESIFQLDHPHEIDFGRGDDAYKKLWMQSRRERWGIEAANPRTAIGAFHAARILAAKARSAILKIN